MVFGANTFRPFVGMVAGSSEGSEVRDPWVTRMCAHTGNRGVDDPAAPPGRPNVTLARGDAVEVVARLKEESEVPLRSHGSLSMNRALMAAGLVDRVQVTLFSVITGQTGLDPIFHGAADFDLELLGHRTLDGQTQELSTGRSCTDTPVRHPPTPFRKVDQWRLSEAVPDRAGRISRDWSTFSEGGWVGAAQSRAGEQPPVRPCFPSQPLGEDSVMTLDEAIAAVAATLDSPYLRVDRRLAREERVVVPPARPRYQRRPS